MNYYGTGWPDNEMHTFTPSIIEALLQNSLAHEHELTKHYRFLPATRCQRKTHCCALLPEMTLLEALSIIRRIKAMTPDVRLEVLRKISSYFFLNAAEITACPFLEGQTCQIYENRFFGCRAYGLWSPTHYAKLAAHSVQAKKNHQKQWQKMGVTLPPIVADFRIPYCLDVELLDDTTINDRLLLDAAHAVESMSESFSEAHQSFQVGYFSDFSFLIASLIYGFRRVVQMKFEVVKEIVATGQRKKLTARMEECLDIFADS